ncbi:MULTISPECIES: hypothetical protein [unclassified Streptomyces]|uniref:hypothetical protein n=1 Tax=unclassified Streptomyces TaxID=2593676 RepID=UPI002E2997B7|nr:MULTISPECIES: hypothetical protein [unclassified Streptomyces]
MAEITDYSRARRGDLKLFPPGPPDAPRRPAPAGRAGAHRRDTATGPLRGTVVTDMQVLMKRCARAGHL